MNKAQTMIIAHDGNKKINEGNVVFCIQANKEGDGYMVNIDWSFAKNTPPDEIKSILGRVLGNIEEVFGEKMVTEALTHYALESNHLEFTPQGPAWHFKSKGLKFKEYKQTGGE